MQRYRLAHIPCSFRFEAKPFLILMYDIERASLLGLDLTAVNSSISISIISIDGSRK